MGDRSGWDALLVGSTPWKTYARIADVLRERWSTGEAGAGVPSEAELAAEFAVARNTIRRALAELEREDLIVSLPGRGRVLRQPGEPTTASYRQIGADLRQEIEDGTLGPGQRVPSESELMARYRVSRGTARQGLAVVEAAGLVTAVHGKGRFVHESGRA